VRKVLTYREGEKGKTSWLLDRYGLASCPRRTGLWKRSRDKRDVATQESPSIRGAKRKRRLRAGWSLVEKGTNIYLEETTTTRSMRGKKKAI